MVCAAGRIALLVGACALLCAPPHAPAIAAEPSPPGAAPVAAPLGPERWKGAITLPGQTLDIEIVFTPTPPAPGAPADAKPVVGATVNIPMQGLTNVACKDVVYSDTTISFTLTLPSPENTWPAFTATRDAGAPNKAAGTMKQMGMEFPVALERLAEGETVGPKRPQDPKPPLPYTSREVEVTNATDGTKLAGTLTIPGAAEFGPGPHPAALLITGSGQQDRDESLLGHKPFLVLADHLTRAGIAVLRVDDRGVGKSTTGKPVEECTTDDFVGDAIACVDFLRSAPEIDPKRVGLIGHSEGGLIAPMVFVARPEVAYIVMLAGPGVNGREILIVQMPAGAKANGAPEETVAQVRERATTFIDAAMAPQSPENDAAVLSAASALLALNDPTGSTDPALLESVAKTVAQQFTSPWMRRFFTLDPRDALRQVSCPVLALNGELDMQVSATQNMPEIEKALKEGKNPDATLKTMPKLNHLFQTATTGGGDEYATIAETFAPAALNEISDWVRARTGLAK